MGWDFLYCMSEGVPLIQREWIMNDSLESYKCVSAAHLSGVKCEPEYVRDN